MSDKKPRYSDDEIVRLSATEHVRLRPGMYFGGRDQSALHHLVYEVMDEAIAETAAGHCDHIWITLQKNQTVAIRDNGRGFSIRVTAHGKNALELIMTSIGAGSLHEGYRVAGGLHGIGLSAVNALASECIVEVAREGYLWRQTYHEGVPQT
jgi:DNA gyrase subunit B